MEGIEREAFRESRVEVDAFGTKSVWSLWIPAVSGVMRPSGPYGFDCENTGGKRLSVSLSKDPEEEFLQPGVGGVVDELGGRPFFHDFTLVHEQDAGGYLPGEAYFMGDHHHG